MSEKFQLHNTVLFIRNRERAAIESVLCYSQMGGASFKRFLYI